MAHAANINLLRFQWLRVRQCYIIGNLKLNPYNHIYDFESGNAILQTSIRLDDVWRTNYQHNALHVFIGYREITIYRSNSRELRNGRYVRWLLARSLGSCCQPFLLMLARACKNPTNDWRSEWFESTSIQSDQNNADGFLSFFFFPSLSSFVLHLIGCRVTMVRAPVYQVPYEQNPYYPIMNGIYTHSNGTFSMENMTANKRKESYESFLVA